MEQPPSAVEQARAAVQGWSTFGYLPEPQRELATPVPLAGTIEIVTRGSAPDSRASWSGSKPTPERLPWILRLADWGSLLQTQVALLVALDLAVTASGNARPARVGHTSRPRPGRRATVATHGFPGIVQVQPGSI